MWDIKQKATNKQSKKSKQKLVDIDNNMVVTRGKGVRGSKGQIYGDRS